MNKYEELETFNKSNDSAIYKCCYSIYKKDYLNNMEFSIQSEDISNEIDDLINDYDNRKKNRVNYDTNSIYSEILNELGIYI